MLRKANTGSSNLHKTCIKDRSIKDMVQEEQERKEHEEINLNEIRGAIRSLRIPPALNSHQFHLIHVNYYCKTIPGLYVPCELAVSKFTLQDGVKPFFNVLINPGELPLGYRYESQKHAEETHQIPMPDEFLSEEEKSDYAKIVRDLYTFLGKTDVDDKLPPLYTVTSQLEPCENVLNSLSDSINENLFRVYPAKEMLFELQHACVDACKPTESNLKLAHTSLAEQILENNVFDYTKGISCTFHEGTDAVPYCSLSCVKRWSFLILDCCYQVTNIPLIPGRHIPEEISASQFRKLKAQVLLKKDIKKVNSAIQNLYVKDSRNAMTCSTVQTDAVNMVRQNRRHRAASARTLRAPKQVSDAIKLLSPADSDDEQFPLYS